MKAALLIDGNFIIYRTVSVVQSTADSNIKIDSDEDMAIFMRKIAMDFCSQARLFDGLFDTVVWTIDRKSWRKTYFPELEYKANRTVDTTINWDNVSIIRDEFLNIMKQNGVLVSVVEEAEGDDLICEWVKYYKGKRKPSIVISGDRDLNQLVYFNNISYCIQYSPITSKLYGAVGFEDWLNTAVNDKKKVDIFNFTKVTNESDKILLHDIVKQKSSIIIEINSDDFIFKKVLVGDSGDNVKPAFNYQSPNKTGKIINHGISEAKAEKIVEEYKLNHKLNVSDLYDIQTVMPLANIVFNTMKASGIMSVDNIAQNIILNAKLMVLNDEYSIPEKITESIKVDIMQNEEKRKNLNFQNLTSMQNLLKNTKYIDENYIQIKSDIFKGENIDEKDTSFITNTKTKLF